MFETTTLSNEIRRIEKVICDYEAARLDDSAARSEVCNILEEITGITPKSSGGIEAIVRRIAQNYAGIRRTELASIIIRLIAIEDLISNTLRDKMRLPIIRIVETGNPHVLPKRADNELWGKLQNHEKIPHIAQVHEHACQKIRSLRRNVVSLAALNEMRQTIMEDLGDKRTQSYLAPFDFQSVRDSVKLVLKLVDNVVDCPDQEFQEKIRRLSETIEQELIRHEAHDTFVSKEYTVYFLRSVRHCAASLRAERVANFECNLSVAKDPYEPFKKYPLHIVGHEMHILVPLNNSGPGVAQDVMVSCDSQQSEVEVKTDEIPLGNIGVGRFMLTLKIKVSRRYTRVELAVLIRWGIVDNPSVREEVFSVIVRGQRTDVDWNALQLRKEPYSTEIAYGKDFYGREEALKNILRWLNPSSMQSLYISGQKRVGKSSLACAIETKLNDGIHISNPYHVRYLETGEYKNVQGNDTLRALGSELERFFIQHLDMGGDHWKRQDDDYSKSLAPLSRLADQILRLQETLRFVVILDEFDEINESLYGHGDLANTFFQNLRTLSTKRNIAFVLVGAERMPHVMASQGDKLNKFKHVSLSSFNKGKESDWEDYCTLIRAPVDSIIKYHDEAIQALYDLTDGHPYFTKILCQDLYSRSLEARDAEISRVEVDKIFERVSSSLDTNVFMHYWKDGVPGDSQNVEIVSTKRQYLLVAWARAFRNDVVLNCNSISDCLRSTTLSSQEVQPILDDFRRRSVFRETNGCYFPTVRLFAIWLREHGINCLLTDRLGDELEAAKQHQEDDAYVQDSEILELVDSWDLYQGQKITDGQVRRWLAQVETHVERRLLFKLLQNLRFVSEIEVRKMFGQADSWIRKQLPQWVQRQRAARRSDIYVTYFGGPAKSGACYANLYASESKVTTQNIIEFGELFDRVVDMSNVGVVIVDDFIGTGDTFLNKLREHSTQFLAKGIGDRIPLSLVTVCSTRTGSTRIRSYLEKTFEQADLYSCEILDDWHYAFGENVGIWQDEEEKSRAKSLCQDLGSRVQIQSPLGYKRQGLLLTLFRNCPNNSLPILHSKGKRDKPWRPLFLRSK